jgi:osmotically-inducible protein OsmY
MKNFKRASSLLAIFAVAGLMGCASTSKSEGTGEYVDDTVITAKVKTAIFEQPSLKSAEINVETFKGIVQLSGFVSSQDKVNVAVNTAKGVRGVASVKNDMIVK